MLRFIYIFILMLNLTWQCYGQVDSILSLPKEKQKEAIFLFYQNLHPDCRHRLEVMQPLAEEMGRKKEKDLQEMIWSMIWIDKLNCLPHRDSVIEVKFMEDLISGAAHHNWKKAKSECTFQLGIMYFGWRSFSVGMDMMMRSYETSEKIGWTSPYIKSSLLSELGKSYYHFGDYLNCLNYLQEGIPSGLSYESVGYPYYSFNTMGLAHLQLQNFDSAAYYFTLSHDIATIHHDSSWMALTIG